MHQNLKRTKPCIAILLLLLSGCQVKTSTPEAKQGAASTPAPVTGMDIKAISLSSAAADEFSLASYRGRVLVLDFWATWSAPSRAGMPQLNKLAQEWAPQNVALVGMVVDRGDRAQVMDAVKAFDLSYPVAWGDENVQAAFGGIRAVPTKVLVDKKGQIRKQLPGAVSEATLRAEVSTLIAEN